MSDMGDVTVRLAGDLDMPAIMELRAEWTREHDGEADDPGYAARFAQWFEQESRLRLTWLALDGKRAVGMMNLAVFSQMPRPGRAPSHWGYLANAFVLAQYRDRGIGTMLLDTVLRYADDNRFVRVLLNPSKRAVSFYRRAGFGDADALLLRPLPD